MTRTAYVTHEKGSWRWQNRYALVLYTPRVAKRGKHAGKPIWTSTKVLDDKVKPHFVRQPVGSLHNQPLSISECVIWALYGDKD